MRLATYTLPLATLLTAMTMTSIGAPGCARVAQSQPVPPAPIAEVVPPESAPDEWNVFPDPLSGNVEVYHNGESIGSITGDEKEDPPVPHPIKDPHHPDPAF